MGSNLRDLPREDGYDDDDDDEIKFASLYIIFKFDLPLHRCAFFTELEKVLSITMRTHNGDKEKTKLTSHLSTINISVWTLSHFKVCLYFFLPSFLLERCEFEIVK